MIIFSISVLKQQQVLHQSTENNNSHLFEIQIVFRSYWNICISGKIWIFNHMSDTMLYYDFHWLCAKLRQD